MGDGFLCRSWPYRARFEHAVLVFVTVGSILYLFLTCVSSFDRCYTSLYLFVVPTLYLGLKRILHRPKQTTPRNTYRIIYLLDDHFFSCFFFSVLVLTRDTYPSQPAISYVKVSLDWEASSCCCRVGYAVSLVVVYPLELNSYLSHLCLRRLSACCWTEISTNFPTFPPTVIFFFFLRDGVGGAEVRYFVVQCIVGQLVFLFNTIDISSLVSNPWTIVEQIPTTRSTAIKSSPV